MKADCRRTPYQTPITSCGRAVAFLGAPLMTSCASLHIYSSIGECEGDLRRTPVREESMMLVLSAAPQDEADGNHEGDDAGADQ